MKDYPPAHVIHEENCPDAPRGLPVFRAEHLVDYSNSRPHHCFNRETVAHNRMVVAEPGDYEPHPYVPSSIHPADAVKPLCRVCRSTHPAEPVDLRKWLQISA